MSSKKRIPSRLLASLAFVALTGLAVSCGEEQSSGGGEEQPAQKTESAQAPAPKAEETTEKAEKTEPEKTEAEKPKAEEPKAEVLPAEGEPAEGLPEEELEDQTAGAAAYEYQYEDSQYEDDETKGNETDEVAAAPSDSTMYLSVPALGISGTPVIDENSEAALTAGTMHLPGTGFPSEEGANTYIAGHRVGYPGTPSDRIFYDLPSMSMGDEVTLTDANGETYSYAVSEIFAVTPFDTWVTGPTGADTVTLQVCTETPDDWFTIGPRLMSSGPESGRLIVRATRV